MVKDVVCGMSIDPEKAATKMTHKGQTHYFCSQSCHQQFMVDPEKYIEAVR